MALDQTFDADTLADLRKAVLAVTAAAGMPDHRAAEVVLAVHELAANAVRHGSGAGWARLRVAGGELHCQVSDAGPGSPDGHAHTAGAGQAPSWPVRRGHGLWLVQKAADQVTITSGPGGSEVTAVFALSGSRDGKAGA
jgi:anti-sigma regulatory factor (Ser/Thr protein kinase)